MKPPILKQYQENLASVSSYLLEGGFPVACLLSAPAPLFGVRCTWTESLDLHVLVWHAGSP